MVLEEQAGPEILVWPFLENKVCAMPNTSEPVPGLVPSDPSSFPSSALSCPHASGYPWKALEGGGRTGGREKLGYFSPLLSASVAGALPWLQTPEGQDHGRSRQPHFQAPVTRLYPFSLQL